MSPYRIVVLFVNRSLVSLNAIVGLQGDRRCLEIFSEKLTLFFV
jgi:hypothetical protein